MAKKATQATSARSKTVTSDRAARLYRLLTVLSERPQTREGLRRRLRLDVRGFYRDLELLREAGIELTVVDRHYVLPDDVEALIARLPFPDPRLTLGEAIQLAKGRTRAHRKLNEQVAMIVKKYPHR
jgi:hypothetical protein